MIPSGIYEQIVNKKLFSELSTLDWSQYDIELTKLEAADAHKILTIYISYIIKKGLHYIRDNYTTSEDKEALIAQIRLCNDIICEIKTHTESDDFCDYTILEKGEVLTSLYQKLNSARSISNIKVTRPETSLVESTLFTGSKQEPNMLSELKKEISSCDSIDLLVSFIKWSAIRRIIMELREFTSRPNTRLRILTTTYMKATDYKAIIELASLPNTEVKINYETSHMRMHAKSYLFKRNTGFSTAYIGSSNLSNPALTEGLEWNIKVTEQESFDIIKKFCVTFESYWNDAHFELFNPSDEMCKDKLYTELAKIPDSPSNKFQLQCTINPYPYQQEILDNLLAERNLYGHKKNLVIASTGVGKTIIAALDYRNYRQNRQPARLLFIAHRKEILEQSIQKFREVLNDFNFGDLYVDGNRPAQIDYLFMSIQSFNASDFKKDTSPHYYDFIIVDEFHHAAADSYQALLSHYTPDILLGLTATPERLDGKDILNYFDGRIASEMRLVEAIDRKLLSPFQYFGISDTIDYTKLTWRGKYDVNELENLYTADTKRTSMILKSLFQYVTDINDVKGLGFCVSIAHANFMANYFNQNDVPSIALSSKSVDDIRNEAKNDLVAGKIKFIFVVDLYNEGVDIPQVNTILFLRPTQSATIFLQQLGRGLRLHEGKECLTVLDFIGQAHRNYNFEIKFRALVGKSRRSIKHYIEHGFSNLPRGSYIQLEKLAQKYVLRNLKQSTIDKRSLIQKVKYFETDTGLPLQLDYFLHINELTLFEFYQSNGSRSLYRLKKWAQLIQDSRDVDDSIYRSMSGLFHINSKRLLDFWLSYISIQNKPSTDEERIMLNMLYYTFFKNHPIKAGFKTIEEGIYSLIQYDFILDEIIQILSYNLNRIDFIANSNDYTFTCPLEVHCQYNTRQILAAFNYFNEFQSPEFREGVKYLEDKKTDIYLINLNKTEKEFSPSTMYDDYAINETLFHWQSQSRASDTSPTIQRYIRHKELGSNISLFVREFKKTDNYTTPYTFLGNATYLTHYGSKPVSFTWKLDTPIPANLLQKANKSVII
jgi:superfamily II DNA or RNA helicase